MPSKKMLAQFTKAQIIQFLVLTDGAAPEDLPLDQKTEFIFNIIAALKERGVPFVQLRRGIIWDNGTVEILWRA